MKYKPYEVEGALLQFSIRTAFSLEACKRQIKKIENVRGAA